MNQQVHENEMIYPSNMEATFPYSVRIEQTAKGARVSIHVYGKDSKTAIEEAIETYHSTRRKLHDIGLKVAAEE